MLTATASASCDSRCSILTLRDCLRGLNLARPVLTFCSRQNRPLWNVHVTRDFAQTDARGVCRANFCPRRFCYDALHIVLINAVEPFFQCRLDLESHCNRQASKLEGNIDGRAAMEIFATLR